MMFLLLVAVLSSQICVQGGTVNLTLEHPAHVILDECMYFEGLLLNDVNLTPGVYQIRVTHSCLGLKNIRVYSNGTSEILSVEVRKSENVEDDVIKLEEEVLSLKKSLKKAIEDKNYLNSVIETLNTLNVELYDKIKKIRDENEKLKVELEEIKTRASNYSDTLKKLEAELSKIKQDMDKLTRENENLKEKLQSAKSSLGSTQAYLEFFRTSFFFVLALLVGTYFALIRR